MNKNHILGLLVLILHASNVQAKTQVQITGGADSVEAMTLDSAPSSGNAYYLTGILGTLVSQQDAKEICEQRGMRLPTARELARHGDIQGALGISETEKAGYVLVQGSDSLGNPDPFYYNSAGYDRPYGQEGRVWIWTSSVSPQDPNFAYAFDGWEGVLDLYNRYGRRLYSGVRCVYLRAE